MYKKIILILMVFSNLKLEAGEIALTFDDAPRGDGQIYSGIERTSKIISVLNKHNIKTVFFVNSNKIPNFNGEQRMLSYEKAGHIIANHTHSHLGLSGTPLNEYIADTELAHKILSKHSTFKKWFRFPFLDEGGSPEKRDNFRKFLNKKGYINGYVTIDNYDYFIDDLVQKALGSGLRINEDKACSMLVDLMWEGIKYYDSAAKKHIGTVRHVLLMHENDIEALCLERLISTIRRHKWKVVNPEWAFADPLLSKIPNTMYLNQGRIAALVHEKTGIELRSKWESTSNLTEEFQRRKIIIE